MGFVALTLGLMLALLIALLAVPLTVAFSVHRIEKTKGLVRFRWLFGLVRIQLRIPRPAKARSGIEPAPPKKTKPPRRRKRKGGASGMLSLLGQPALRRRVFRFVRDVVRATHPRKLFVRMRIGLGDPADTGRLWAIVGPVAGIARSVRSAELRIEPEFIEPVFEVAAHGRFRLVPIRFIALTTAFLLSPTMLRAWWRLSRGTS